MKTINHECYVSPEIAKLLEQVGFDWKCKYAYIVTPEGDMSTGEEGMLTDYVENVNWIVKAPTLDVAQRWLREVKGLIVQIDFLRHNKWWYLVLQGERVETLENPRVKFNTYEQAQEAGIKKVLEIILEKSRIRI